jgi:hypothetical protein
MFPHDQPVPNPVRGSIRIRNQAQPQAENRAAVPRQFGQGGEGLAIIGQTPGRRTRGARGRRRQNGTSPCRSKRHKATLAELTHNLALASRQPVARQNALMSSWRGGGSGPRERRLNRSRT